ncbi:MAG TPA: FHA domain-containing protein [Actinomycetes bacterium]|nr:FHA domain-containing protein [Actinomycetes bacterium]
MFCTQCGTKNPEGARFCANCGAALFAADDTPTSTISLTPQEVENEVESEFAAPVEELREGTAMLVVRRGPNAGSRFLLDKDVTTAGRHPESDIFLDDITVSRRHAEIRRTPVGFTVHDVGSLNGTYLNRERVDDDELSNGDELQVGKFKLVFFSGSRPSDG